MSRQGDARRLQQAIVDLGRITTSRRLGASRAERAGVEIAPAAAAVLRHVVLEGPIRPVALSERTRMKPPALSRQLKTLEADGLIERVATPDDGRGATLRPTRAGRALQRRLEQADDEILGEQLARWSATELSTLADLLERFVVDLRTPSAPPPSRPSRPTRRSR
jgi:DNA-binding MarR family transcriptional regulator